MIYDYECKLCGHTEEHMHKSDEAPIIKCIICDARGVYISLTKVISPVKGKISDYTKDGKWCGDSSKYLKNPSKRLFFGPPKRS